MGILHGLGTVLEVGAGLLIALAVVGLLQTGPGDYGPIYQSIANPGSNLTFVVWRPN